MRIAIVTESFFPFVGGGETYFFEIARRLAKKHEIHVFTLHHQGLTGDMRVPSEEIIEDIYVHRYCFCPQYYTQDGFRNTRDVLRFGLETFFKIDTHFDIINLNQWPLAHVLPVKLRTRNPLVLTWFEVWHNYWRSLGLIGGFGEIFEWLNSKLPTYHICISEVMRRRLLELYGVEKRKTSVIPAGVDLQSFRAINVNKRWGKIIYVGRLVPHKHVSWLIGAYKRLFKKGLPVTLHIVGDGPLKSKLMKLAEGIPGITFHGYLPREKLIEELKSAWIHVLPSTREGQSIACLEAMAAGTPTIAVRYEMSAVNEIIKDKWNGILVEPSEEAITTALALLLKDEALWSMLQANGKITVQRFDWNVIANHTEELFRNIIEAYRV
jgi:glycosyltransferase involved in cell wall biosynthesis